MKLGDLYGRTRETGGRRCQRVVRGGRAVPSPCGSGSATGRTTPTAMRSTSIRWRTVRRLRRCLRPDEPAVRRPLTAPPGNGDPRRRARVQVDRLGLGRRLVGRHEGLHALLDDRALARGRPRPGRRPRLESLELVPVGPHGREDVDDDRALRARVHLVRRVGRDPPRATRPELACLGADPELTVPLSTRPSCSFSWLCSARPRSARARRQRGSAARRARFAPRRHSRPA